MLNSVNIYPTQLFIKTTKTTCCQTNIRMLLISQSLALDSKFKVYWYCDK